MTRTDWIMASIVISIPLAYDWWIESRKTGGFNREFFEESVVIPRLGRLRDWDLVVLWLNR
jgi:hypothetical protein